MLQGCGCIRGQPWQLRQCAQGLVQCIERGKKVRIGFAQAGGERRRHGRHRQLLRQRQAEGRAGFKGRSDLLLGTLRQGCGAAFWLFVRRWLRYFDSRRMGNTAWRLGRFNPLIGTQGIADELGGVGGGEGLLGVLALPLVAVREVADGLDDDPGTTNRMRCDQDTRGLHFAADGLGIRLPELTLEDRIIDQLLTGQNLPETDLGTRPARRGRYIVQEIMKFPINGDADAALDRLALTDPLGLVAGDPAGDQDGADRGLVLVHPESDTDRDACEVQS